MYNLDRNIRRNIRREAWRNECSPVPEREVVENGSGRPRRWASNCQCVRMSRYRRIGDVTCTYPPFSAEIPNNSCDCGVVDCCNIQVPEVPMISLETANGSVCVPEG